MSVRSIRTYLTDHSEMRDLARVRLMSDFIATEVQAAGRAFLPSQKSAAL